MSHMIDIDFSKLQKIRVMDQRLISYNIEMTEVTGGTFWKPYTPAQIAGTEAFPPVTDFNEFQKLMGVFKPTDLSNERLIKLAKALGPVYIRVSGTWASSTYYDFSDAPDDQVPDGFSYKLTKKQWNGVLDFVKAVDGRLLVSVANCDGAHNEDGTWNPAQAKLLFDCSIAYGVPIYATEFMNEPTIPFMGGTPKQYKAKDYARDQDLYYRFIRENYPDVVIAGPCGVGEQYAYKSFAFGGETIASEDILTLAEKKADVFSYHCYTGVSERCAALVPGGHWDVQDALSEEYLAVPVDACRFYAKLRDDFYPNAPMWVTESADSGCGGNTWASTFLDIIRYADELGRFCTLTNGAIFHNTLASSDYGLLDRTDHLPRPSYWLVYLWSKLVGSVVYDADEPIRDGVHLFAHSRKDGKDGYAFIAVNNSKTESLPLRLPVACERYTLSSPVLRAPSVRLNGLELRLADGDELPALIPITERAGTIELEPATVTFLIVGLN